MSQYPFCFISAFVYLCEVQTKIQGKNTVKQTQFRASKCNRQDRHYQPNVCANSQILILAKNLSTHIFNRTHFRFCQKPPAKTRLWLSVRENTTHRKPNLKDIP